MTLPLPADRDRQVELAMIALAAVTEEPVRVDSAREAVLALADFGPHAMFGAMCGWSESVRVVAYGNLPDDGGFFGLAAIDEITGKPIDPDSKVTTGDDWGAVNGMRFVVAGLNRDYAAMHAIFNSPPDPGAAVGLVMSVLQYAGATCRAAIERKRAGEAKP